MKKRKLIEVYQPNLIVCDNKTCDFKIQNPTGDINEDISSYINIPCPECGQNLLTEEDYLLAMKVQKKINWLNKWFSWVLLVIPKKKLSQNVSMHIHNGIKIENK